MIKKILIFPCGILFVFSLLVSNTYAEVIRLHIPVLSDSPQLGVYFHELLKTAVKEAGHKPDFVSRELPHIRIKNLLDRGEISIYWLVESAERNKKYFPIKVGITSGLIGKRILFIKKGEQALFDKVKTLDDFRELNLVGGMGVRWFDGKVWKANNLLYKEKPGNWKAIYEMVSRGRDFNYFSRGLNEILVESKQYPDLAIEKRLVLIYDRDFRFYLSKTGKNAGAKYKEFLVDALNKAKESGLIERLVRKYWSNDFKSLNYDKRIKLYLKTPK